MASRPPKSSPVAPVPSTPAFVVPAPNLAEAPSIPHEVIAARAYEKFVARGGEHGLDVDDWTAAVDELGSRQRRGF